MHTSRANPRTKAHTLARRPAGRAGAARWARALAPLTDAFVERFEAFLPKATYPLRVGTHFNTAFALTLALDFARQRRTRHARKAHRGDGTALARALPESDACAAVLREAAQTHLDAALDHVAGDYMGEHWLATFATLALEA